MDTAIADFEEGVEHEGYDNEKAHLTEGRLWDMFAIAAAGVK